MKMNPFSGANLGGNGKMPPSIVDEEEDEGSNAGIAECPRHSSGGVLRLNDKESDEEHVMTEHMLQRPVPRKVSTETSVGHTSIDDSTEDVSAGMLFLR